MATMQERPKYRPSGFPGQIHLKHEEPEEEHKDEAISSMLEGRGPSEPTEDEVEDDEIVTRAEKDWESNHLTRIGTPDRRFRENRALTEEDVGNPYYRRASSGKVIQGVHVTRDGAPDRRFKENRTLSEEDVEVRKAELILAKHGLYKPESRTGR